MNYTGISVKVFQWKYVFCKKKERNRHSLHWFFFFTCSTVCTAVNVAVAAIKRLSSLHSMNLRTFESCNQINSTSYFRIHFYPNCIAKTSRLICIRIVCRNSNKRRCMILLIQTRRNTRRQHRNLRIKKQFFRSFTLQMFYKQMTNEHSTRIHVFVFRYAFFLALSTFLPRFLFILILNVYLNSFFGGIFRSLQFV